LALVEVTCPDPVRLAMLFERHRLLDVLRVLVGGSRRRLYANLTEAVPDQ
jgi:hypothetical protein